MKITTKADSKPIDYNRHQAVIFLRQASYLFQCHQCHGKGKYGSNSNAFFSRAMLINDCIFIDRWDNFGAIIPHMIGIVTSMLRTMINLKIGKERGNLLSDILQSCP